MTLLLLLGAFIFFAQSTQAATIVIRPSNMRDWTFYNDVTGGPGSGSMINGPGTAPYGTGSLIFQLTGPEDAQIINTPKFSGIRIADITTLKYSSFQSPRNSSNTNAITLQLVVSASPGNNGYQGRMSFEPYLNNGGTIEWGRWDQWDALNHGNAIWWFTNPEFFNNHCPQSSPCTLSQMLSYFPNLMIHTYSHNFENGIILKSGLGWEDFRGDADGLIIGLKNSREDTIYDFEANAPVSNSN